MKRTTTNGTTPKINCSHDALVPTGKLKPHPDNPNKHPEAQLALYAKILRHQGWRVPITVSNLSGLIVAGHGAWLTARKEGWDKVPVDYQDFATRADEIAHMIAVNKLPQLAEFDGELLAQIIDKDIKNHIDLDLTGFEIGKEDLTPELPPAPETVQKNLEDMEAVKKQRREGNIIAKTDTEYYLTIVFPNRASKEALLKRLGLPEDERYLTPQSVVILPGDNRQPARRPKSSPPHKAGACG